MCSAEMPPRQNSNHSQSLCYGSQTSTDIRDSAQRIELNQLSPRNCSKSINKEHWHLQWHGPFNSLIFLGSSLGLFSICRANDVLPSPIFPVSHAHRPSHKSRLCQPTLLESSTKRENRGAFCLTTLPRHRLLISLPALLASIYHCLAFRTTSASTCLSIVRLFWTSYGLDLRSAIQSAEMLLIIREAMEVSLPHWTISTDLTL